MSQKIKNETKKQYLYRVKQNRKLTSKRDKRKFNIKTEVSKKELNINLKENKEIKFKKEKSILKRKQDVFKY